MTIPGTVTHPWRRDPNRDGRQRRPLPSHARVEHISDDEVAEIRGLLRQHGITDLLNDAVKSRPGPKLSVSPEALVVGMFLAVRHRHTCNLDDVSEILWLGLYPNGRALLDLPREKIDAADTYATRAAYDRVQRTMSAVTTELDPHRHNRRRRLTAEEILAIRAGWADRPDKIEALNRLTSALIHASIAEAEAAGALASWDGAIGVDDTCAAPQGRPPRRDKALDPHANWYYKGGDQDGEGTWAVAAMLAFTGQPRPNRGYVQLCLGLRTHLPGSGGDAAACEIIEDLDARFDIPRSHVVGDRFFSGCAAEKFQNRIRATGREPVFDYKVDFLGRQDKPTTSPTGAIWAAGVPYCPATPEHFLDAGKLLAKGTSREDKLEGQRLIELSLPYALHTKQNPRTPGGQYRKGCPAAGPNATVSCARYDERHGIAPSAPSKGRAVIKKIGPREFERSNAALPRVQPPPLLASAWPAVCQSDSITFQPGDNAKLRQPYAHGSSQWRRHYQAVRGQNEGGNGTAKGIDIDLGDPKRRRPRGTVALAIQLAIQITTANLAQIYKWLIGQPSVDNILAEQAPAGSTLVQEPNGRSPASPTMSTGPPTAPATQEDLTT